MTAGYFEYASTTIQKDVCIGRDQQNPHAISALACWGSIMDAVFHSRFVFCIRT